MNNHERAQITNDYEGWREAQDERRERDLVIAERNNLQFLADRFNGEEN